MDLYTVQRADEECDRFANAVGDLLRRVKLSKIDWKKGCRETAAVRRASMDLSRALADLRRADND